MKLSDAQSRWLPPSPHREKLLETLARGRAHLEDRGHGKPPLLVYEDGGTMELPRFRWDGKKAVAAEGSQPDQQTTRFLDVCGTIDELKRLLAESSGGEPEEALQLIADALYMIGRMQDRLGEYHEFKDQVAAQVAKMHRLTGPDPTAASESAASLRQLILDAPDEAGLELLFERAEAIRSTAQRLEEALYPLRDACIEIAALCERIRGAREWKQALPASL